MIRWKALIALLSGAAALLLTSQQAQALPDGNPPVLMTYQGFLADGNGNALATNAPRNYDVIFRIWDSSSGGNKLWAEQQTVTVDKGYFSVLLGEGSSIGEARPVLSTVFTNDTASDRWVGLTVKGIGAAGADVDILPRLRLLSSPYSFLSHKAMTVDGAGLISGTIPDARMSTNVALRSGGNTFSGNQILNGNLGVGTNNPGARLHVMDSAYLVERLDSVNAAGTWLALGNSSTGGRFWQLISTGSGNGGGAGKLLITSGSVPASTDATPMTFQSDGKVGVGTLTPSERLHVNGGNLQVSGGGILMDNTQTLQAKNSSGTMENWMWPRWSDNITYLNYGSGGFNIRNNASVSTMFMQSNGNVGIGTTTAGDQLQIGEYNKTDQYMSIKTSGGNLYRAGIKFRHYNDTGGFNIEDDERGGVNGNGLNFIRYPFGTAASAMFIDRFSGYVGMGTTAPSWPLTVRNDSSTGMSVERSDGRYAAFYRNGSQMILQMNLSTFSAGTRYAVYDGDSNWDFGSDRRLKKDIVDAEAMLDRAMQIEVRRFRWKDSTPDSKHILGVIAQEVQPLFPDVVGEMEDPVTKEKSLTVGYSDFGLIAIKALQEFKKQHDTEMSAMKEQIANLSKENEQLRSQLKTTSTTAVATVEK